MDRVERCADYFAQGYACSQSVLLAFAEDLHLDPQTAARISAGFGGGMGRTAGTCGAVTGALMVIGLHTGSPVVDAAAKDATYTLVRRFMAEFAARNGSTECRDLLGCDISGPEGSAYAREHNLFKTQCPEYVKEAVRILEGMLVPTP
jgi:C_GCAxxG_C_C family probable redox protein